MHSTKKERRGYDILGAVSVLWMLRKSDSKKATNHSFHTQRNWRRKWTKPRWISVMWVICRFQFYGLFCVEFLEPLLPESIHSEQVCSIAISFSNLALKEAHMNKKVSINRRNGSIFFWDNASIILLLTGNEDWSVVPHIQMSLRTFDENKSFLSFSLHRSAERLPHVQFRLVI